MPLYSIANCIPHLGICNAGYIFYPKFAVHSMKQYYGCQWRSIPILELREALSSSERERKSFPMKVRCNKLFPSMFLTTATPLFFSLLTGCRGGGRTFFDDVYQEICCMNTYHVWILWKLYFQCCCLYCGHPRSPRLCPIFSRCLDNFFDNSSAENIRIGLFDHIPECFKRRM